MKKGIPDPETLQSLFLGENTAQELARLRKELETRIAALKETAAVTTSLLKTEAAKELTTEPATGLREKLEAVELEYSALNQEIGKLKQVLAADQLTRGKFAELARQIEVQKAEFARWNKTQCPDRVRRRQKIQPLRARTHPQPPDRPGQPPPAKTERPLPDSQKQRK